MGRSFARKRVRLGGYFGGCRLKVQKKKLRPSGFFASGSVRAMSVKSVKFK
jgi:hypothetical protein